MANKYLFIPLYLSVFTILLELFELPARGEALRVVSDNTTQTDITGNAQCTADCVISGSSRLGNNLFHSFSEFSIPSNVTATFEDGGATNIFTRVSNQATSILGTLAVTGEGQANFFLMNPQGITFGPQGGLLSAGSFIASTANRTVFSDGTVFDARDNALPVLTISTPIGFQFGQNPGAITNQSRSSLEGAVNAIGEPVGLKVTEGKSLALLGNSILLDNGNLTASNSRIEIGSVAANSRVSISPDLALGYENTSDFSNIQLTGNAAVDVSGSDGRIFIQGDNISLKDQSSINNFSLSDTSAGSIVLVATNTIEVSGFGLFFSSFPGATGDGGNLNVIARRLIVDNGGLISGGTAGDGDGGSITVNTSESVEVRGTGSFSPSLIATSTDGSGTGGALIINTPRLSVVDGAQIQAVTYGPGQGGDLVINATNRVDVRGWGATDFVEKIASGISASSGVEGLPFLPTGAGGSLTINTGMLNLAEKAQVSVNSLGSGDSGDLRVNARTVRLEGGAQLTAAAAFGNGGNIQIENAESLVLRRGSVISTRAGLGDGQGDGGNISIDSDFIVTRPLEDSDIIAKATQGRGGNINIATLGLYGIDERRAIPNNGTNDIDASSDFGISGTIAINQVIDDNDQGLVELSERALETTAAVSQGCQANGNRLVVTGRGGLPTVPANLVEAISPLVDLGRSYANPGGLATDKAEVSGRRGAINQSPMGVGAMNDARTLASDYSNESPWVEASGWQRDEFDQIVLTVEPRTENFAALQAAAHCAG